MIPILWRTLLESYVRVLFLSLSTFLTVLLVNRFKEIARFTALSGDGWKTLFFTAYQFPLILPIAIPISALIASFLLFQRLSRTHELIAFRASGLSFRSIIAPLLFASALFSIGNFSMCAEIAPFCRRASKSMLSQETSLNPLLLLQRQQLIKIKHAYFKMNIQKEGRFATDVTLIAHNEAHKRLSLLQALSLSVNGEELLGENVTIVSHLDSSSGEFDPLIIENQASMSTAAPTLSQFLKKGNPRFDASALPLRMLLLRAHMENHKLAASALVEILRRFSLSLAVFSFTFLGCAFGIEQGRHPSKRNLLMGLGFTLTILLTYLMGKEFKAFPLLATFIFLLPHPLIWAVSTYRLSRITRGIVS